MTIDPFNTRRGGYFFGLNANGVRFDGLYRNVSEYYSDWDTIWFAGDAARSTDGWIGRVRDPVQVDLVRSEHATRGGSTSRAASRRATRTCAWVSRNRRWDPSTAGLMTGLTVSNQGIGLDIVPSREPRRTARASRRQSATPRHAGTSDDFEPSLDLFYKITPQLNGSLTINTDFSATEVDDRQVNLTRFGLFFPEKRDFFLRESDIFEFGRIGASDGTGALSNAERQNARPFFSRRIGLGSLGEPVDLELRRQGQRPRRPLRARRAVDPPGRELAASAEPVD